jgi:hypothetical protein
MWVMGFDKAGHLVNSAWIALGARDYVKTLSTCEEVIALQVDLPPDAYFPAACACAALGHLKNAFTYLHLAADRGWAYVQETESQEELAGLRVTSEWATVIERIRRNEAQEAS